MRKLLESFVLTLCVFSTAGGQITYSTYKNERYSYSIDFPSEMLGMRESRKKGDLGMDFISRDKKVHMVVLAMWNQYSFSPRDVAHLDLYRAGLDSDAWAELSSKGFVMTGSKGKLSYFQKTLLHSYPNADINYTLVITYPKSQREEWEPVVRHIAASFLFDPNADVRP